ncbi:hypothetical protein KKB71_01520, partial [Patescibacteria group bacterium]|nr:hypothetical protein [Patescibacteria group bacterium]
AGVGYYIYRDITQKPTYDVGSDVSSQEPEDTSILSSEEIEKQMPDLDKEIVVKADLPANTKSETIIDIQDIIQKLKEDYDNMQLWLQLGLLRKLLGDYDGAIEAWQFVNLIRPNNFVSFGNLGDIYSLYLSDKKKAEENYLKALENGPDQIYLYEKVYEFYRYTIKDNAKVKEILKKGIDLNPNNSQYLQNLLNNF